MNWRIGLMASIIIIITLSAGLRQRVQADVPSFHSALEYQFFGTLTDSLPRGYNGLFAGSGECVECHGFDTAMIASVDLFGNDINLVDDWRATMMANSAKDPFWRAKVSHEVLFAPQLQADIETKCTSCHAPMGHFAALHQGATTYSMAELYTDSIALDGVSCLSCHQLSEIGLGDEFSGQLHFDTAKVAYGPFISPLESPMLNATQYKPEYSEHISTSELCAGCHTLVTETLDLNGEPTGATFVEQATYHEWLNSNYAVQNISCQSCHMPVLGKGQYSLIAGFEVPPRDRFYLHELVGANVNMLKLMRDNAEALQISATPADFEAVIQATTDMLQQQTLDMSITQLDRNIDTTYIRVNLRNKAGHKFPSGYPARRAFIHLVATTATGDTLFQSGSWDNNYEVIGHDLSYEQHYDIIRAENEVQIYEQVLADVSGAPTTLLTRADYSLKDNRLPPLGFTQSHAVYDTTLIVGRALLDDNFNVEDEGGGSGRDQIRYHIPMQGYSEQLFVTASVYYQSMPPKWMAPMLAEETPEIATFRAMFEAADREPLQIATTVAEVEGIVATRTPVLQNVEVRYLGDQTLQINSQTGGQLNIYNYLGQLIQSQAIDANNQTVYLEQKGQAFIIHLSHNGLAFTQSIWAY